MRLKVSINGQVAIIPVDDSATIDQLKEKIKSRIPDAKPGH